MKKVKSFIRAVSPFTSFRKSDSRRASRDEEEPEEDRYASFTWDLQNVNILGAVTKFYVKYNPEKVHKVEAIVEKFRGDELELLRELCKRYDLEEVDMQIFLDSSPLTKKASQSGADIVHSSPKFNVRQQSPVSSQSGDMVSVSNRSRLQPASIFRLGSPGASLKYNSTVPTTAPSRQVYSEDDRNDVDVGDVFVAPANAVPVPVPSKAIHTNAPNANSESTLSQGKEDDRDCIDSIFSAGVQSTLQANRSTTAPKGNGVGSSYLGPYTSTRNMSNPSVLAASASVSSAAGNSELQDVESMRVQLEQTQRELDQARADRNEVISLLHIVSAAPVDVRAVVSGYLRKYALRSESSDDTGPANDVGGSRPKRIDLVKPFSTDEEAEQNSDNNVPTLSAHEPGQRDDDGVQSKVSKRQQRIRKEELQARAAAAVELNPFAVQGSEKSLLQGLNVKMRSSSAPTSPPADDRNNQSIANGNFGGSAWSYSSSNSPSRSQKRSQSQSRSQNTSPKYMRDTVSSAKFRDTPEEFHPSLWQQNLRPEGSNEQVHEDSGPPSSTSSARSGNLTSQKWGEPERSLDQQYELAKQFYLHGLSQNKIAQRMAETNLSLQEQLAAREIATALSPNSSNRQSSQFHDEAPATNSSRNDAEQTTASGSYLQGRFNSPYSYSMAVPRSNGGKELSSEPIVDDWVEYFDPKTRRKYYYSALLRKSTWQRPAGFDRGRMRMTNSPLPRSGQSDLLEENDSHVSDGPICIKSNQSRSENSVSTGSWSSPSMREPMSSAGLGPPGEGSVAGSRASSRSSSPFLAAAHQSQAQVIPLQQHVSINRPSKGSGADSTGGFSRNSSVSSLNSVNQRDSSRSRSRSNKVWASAIDPVSQRMYWYNRETRESVWKKPVDAD